MKVAKRGGVALVSSAAALLTPALAFAEESESSGLELLIPKVGEFVPALIAFLIILVLLCKFAWPPILKMLEAREERIASGVEASDAAKAEAQEMHAQAGEIVASARREASDIVYEAKNEAQQERERILTQAHDEADAIVAQARVQAEEEVQRTYAEATDTVAKMSVAIAEKIVGEALGNSEELQRDVIKKYLSEVGNLNG